MAISNPSCCRSGGGIWLVEIDFFPEDCDCRVAVCTILRRPCGDSRWSVGSQITAYDDTTSACILNGIPDDMVGTAALVTLTEGGGDPYGESLLPEGCDPDGEPYTEHDHSACHFTLIGRCCT